MKAPTPPDPDFADSPVDFAGADDDDDDDDGRSIEAFVFLAIERCIRRALQVTMEQHEPLYVANIVQEGGNRSSRRMVL